MFINTLYIDDIVMCIYAFLSEILQLYVIGQWSNTLYKNVYCTIYMNLQYVHNSCTPRNGTNITFFLKHKADILLNVCWCSVFYKQYCLFIVQSTKVNDATFSETFVIFCLSIILVLSRIFKNKFFNIA